MLIVLHLSTNNLTLFTFYQKCSRDNGGLYDGYMDVLILAWWVMKGGYLPRISIFPGFVRNILIYLEL